MGANLHMNKPEPQLNYSQKLNSIKYQSIQGLKENFMSNTLFIANGPSMN